MIPLSLYIKEYFLSYDQKYYKFSYNFLYILCLYFMYICMFCDETLHILVGGYFTSFFDEGGQFFSGSDIYYLILLQ